MYSNLRYMLSAAHLKASGCSGEEVVFLYVFCDYKNELLIVVIPYSLYRQEVSKMDFGWSVYEDLSAQPFHKSRLTENFLSAHIRNCINSIYCCCPVGPTVFFFFLAFSSPTLIPISKLWG